MSPKFFVAIAFVLILEPRIQAADEEFEQSVLPFLRTHCYSCHDAKQAKAGFRIDQSFCDLRKMLKTQRRGSLQMRSAIEV